MYPAPRAMLILRLMTAAGLIAGFSEDPGFYDPNSYGPHSRCAPFAWGGAVVLVLLPLVSASARVRHSVPQRRLGASAIRQSGAHAGGSERASRGRADSPRISACDRFLPPRLLQGLRRPRRRTPAWWQLPNSWSRWGGALTTTRFCAARSTVSLSAQGISRQQIPLRCPVYDRRDLQGRS
jgi:hypothetical protein